MHSFYRDILPQKHSYSYLFMIKVVSPIQVAFLVAPIQALLRILKAFA